MTTLSRAARRQHRLGRAHEVSNAYAPLTHEVTRLRDNVALATASEKQEDKQTRVWKH